MGVLRAHGASRDAPERIRLEVGDEKEEVSLKIDLPGNAERFTLPNDWLQPGVIYTLISS